MDTYLLVLNGDGQYRLHFDETGELSDKQRNGCEQQDTLFRSGFADRSKRGGIIAQCM